MPRSLPDEQSFESSADAPISMEDRVAQTKHYVDLYFAHFHSHWPILHRATFSIPDEPPLLLQAVLMIGLWVSDKIPARQAAIDLHRKLGLWICEQRVCTLISQLQLRPSTNGSGSMGEPWASRNCGGRRAGLYMSHCYLPGYPAISYLFADPGRQRPFSGLELIPFAFRLSNSLWSSQSLSSNQCILLPQYARTIPGCRVDGVYLDWGGRDVPAGAGDV